jgi:hypothetical protein
MLVAKEIGKAISKIFPLLDNYTKKERNDDN